LKVLGTAATPVYFTSYKDDSVGGDTNNDGNNSQPAAGNWGHINFADTSNDAESIIEHAVIKYGGYHGTCDSYWDNCYDWYYYRCNGRQYYGSIRMNAASPTIRDNIISHSSGWALWMDVYSAPTTSGNALTSNGGNGMVIAGGSITTIQPVTRRWSNVDMVYVPSGDITLGPGVTMEIGPGVKVKPASGWRLFVNGALKIQGTEDNPVRFTSLKDDSVGGDTNNDGANSQPAAGDWGSIVFTNQADSAASVVEYAVFRYGGNGSGGYTGAIRLDGSSPTVAHNVFADGYYGVVLGNSTATISYNDFHGHTKSAIVFQDAQPTIRYNSIYRNAEYGVYNNTASLCINARFNWWGADNGPNDPSTRIDNCGLGGNAGSGDKVTDNVNYVPWETTATVRLGDLFIGGFDIWTDPPTIRERDVAGVGVNIHNATDRTVANVEVCFWDGDPDRDGKLIGTPNCRTQPFVIPLISPFAMASQWTGRVWDTFGLAGDYEICVRVDPNQKITEDDETNNKACRVITILPPPAGPGPDTTPPTGSIIINGGDEITAIREVTNALNAEDNRGGTGVDKMYLVEIGFNDTSRQCLPIRTSGWVPFAETYPWRLSAGGGVKYIQAWFADRAQNISTQPGTDMINYIPPTDSLGQKEWRLYRIQVTENTIVTITLTPRSGDADLYVWRPNSGLTPDYYSNNAGSAQDQIVFLAPQTGVYQIQVHGYEPTVFSLTITTSPLSGESVIGSVRLSTAPIGKVLPSAPLTTSDPTTQMGIPPVQGAGWKAYLSIVRRR
jgi:hypothetical protein